VSTILTRDAILKKVKGRFAFVEVEGWGRIGLRSMTEVQRSRRASQMWDNEQLVQENVDVRRIHTIIDQVMVDEKTPMFTEADVAELREADPVILDELYAKIIEFNAPDEDAGKKDESGG
jgi:hypothetical protein